MFDKDLAGLYEVETKVLLQSVKRNISRFPEDFAFQINKKEHEILRSQFVTSRLGHGGSRYLPYVFTEQGVAMLSSVLKSEQAVQVNIQIIRTFTRLRQMLLENEQLSRRLDELEKKYNGKINEIFLALKHLLHEKEKPRPPIGFSLKLFIYFDITVCDIKQKYGLKYRPLRSQFVTLKNFSS